MQKLSNCKTCDSSYTKKQPTQKYCSSKCKLEALKKTKQCEICGEDFKTRHNSRFCSNKCRAENRRKIATVALSCTNCGTEFTRLKSSVKGDKIGNFCTKKCLLDFSSKTQGKRHYKARGKDVCCDMCGEQFYRQQNAIRNTNFCSPECYFEFIHNDTLTEEERIRNRDYPEYREWRKRVYERDNFTCQCCGEYGNKIVAHHIFNFSQHEHLRTDISNGITLCEGCHKEFHSNYGLKNNNNTQLKEFFESKKAIPSQAD